ncbi:MAG: DUF1049 domain-containing protein [Leptolyngbya sp. SIOISBB]|nr:DUF1049 domain-containing protein [Leptolyngbya sp. SIOISBB]
MRLYVVSALMIAFLAILFALQNTNLATIQLFIWEYQQSLALILLGTLAIGVIVGLLVSVPAMIRRNIQIARLHTQRESLLQQVNDQTQLLQSESQKVFAVQQDYEQKLNHLGVLDPVTTLIRQDLLPQTIAAHLKQTHSQANELPSTNFLSVLLLKVLPVLGDDSALPDLLAAVAKLLQQNATANTWLYSNGQGQFAAVISGLDTKAVTQHGEALQAAILANPPVSSTGQAIEFDVSVGGAIADTTHVTDSHQLLQTAEAALDQARQRGRNRVKIFPLD